MFLPTDQSFDRSTKGFVLPFSLAGMAKKDHGCNKFVTQESFNNMGDGSQDFTNATIKGPRIETSFLNSGSGSQDLKDSTIECDDKSTWKWVKEVTSSGISNFYNYNGNGTLNFFEYMQNLFREGRYLIYSFVSTNIWLIYFTCFSSSLLLLHLFLFYST